MLKVIKFFKTQLNKKTFIVALLTALIFGAFSFSSIAYEGQNINGYILKKGETVSPWNVGVDELGGTFIVKDKSGKITKVITSSNDNAGESVSVWLVKIASNFLTWTVSADLYEKVFFSDIAKRGITQAWEAVRGLINMFYLLILVFLAITTILRVNQFNDKKLFFKVIVSAILVNFSMAITLVVIDFSNLIMVYFASAIQNLDLINTFFNNIGMADNFLGNKNTSWFLAAGANMIEFIINIVIAVMVLFTAISLLIRLVAYWVLIILSPLAFFSIAVPGSSSFNEWREKLIHYSFYGPIMLFFIWLALALSSYLKDAFTHAEGIDGWNGFVRFLTSYITVIYLLYYGHDKSKSMAKKAGDTVGMLMDKGGKYAVTAGKGAAMLTPIGWAGAGAKSGGTALYTGAKANLMEGKYTRNIFEEGRKKSQEELNRKAEYKFAGKNKQERMEMEDIIKKEKAMKDGGFDMENVDALERMAKSGSKLEKKVAANKLADLNKLDSDKLKIAMAAAKGNKTLEDKILRQAGKKNKIAQLKWYAENPNDLRSKKFLEKQIKNIPDALKDVGIKNVADIKNDKMRYNLALQQGILPSLNINDQIALINEDKTTATAEAVKKYHMANGGLTDREIDSMLLKTNNNKAREIIRTIERRTSTSGSAGSATIDKPVIEVVSGGPGSGGGTRSTTIFGPDGKLVKK